MNEAKYFLGKLCPHNHEYQQTAQSLRYKTKPKSCVLCNMAKDARIDKSKCKLNTPVRCTICGKEFMKKKYEARSTNGKHACSKVCHNQLIGNKGGSEMERYFHIRLTTQYPDIEFIIGDYSIIDMQLDLYFPQLNLAVEINGPHHYEPIYGEKSFINTQRKDIQRIELCKAKGIDLLIIDTSNVGYFRVSQAEEHFQTLITAIQKRQHLIEK